MKENLILEIIGVVSKRIYLGPTEAKRMLLLELIHFFPFDFSPHATSYKGLFYLYNGRMGCFL